VSHNQSVSPGTTAGGAGALVETTTDIDALIGNSHSVAGGAGSGAYRARAVEGAAAKATIVLQLDTQGSLRSQTYPGNPVFIHDYVTALQSILRASARRIRRKGDLRNRARRRRPAKSLYPLLAGCQGERNACTKESQKVPLT
jgi:hypothetical protein